VTEAVLFDFNGVLVDDEDQHCVALQRVLQEEGITLTREQYYAEYLGFDDRTGFVEAYRRAQRTLTTELLRSLVQRKSQPDPAGYLAAHSALNQRRPLSPSGCVVIEDSLPGLQAAQAAGMACVMLTTSHGAQTLEGRGAVRVWESLAGHSAAELAAL
jgi:beta-phosphoglucomutase-like phosphatase (HAD superfamily)